ncbi:hypothetical protein AMAG_04548 [Allomyces macrogynus ATCC 38327]|uniref:RNA-binding protein vts1-like alpha-helical domain-containing protein n=1 Tax=Allomyces macrogynus (strain ATCC 38327) TaxID=578462 RepID=A0A0L0S5P9_ALLM3|nr:hypothetical protein, variant [Allomyces macrogynus ATCC 38327]KNE57689.1 hypothetical protein AMAG_04548 [Allomyces macrogynus ATCC 38327]|eukprot:KNE57688.1 hypothetical protein, variant [Allomyces macrogynus ATCC 38327]
MPNFRYSSASTATGAAAGTTAPTAFGSAGPGSPQAAARPRSTATSDLGGSGSGYASALGLGMGLPAPGGSSSASVLSAGAASSYYARDAQLVDAYARQLDALDEMRHVGVLDAAFREELMAIEDWFRVLSDMERATALYTLLQYVSPAQIRFFLGVLQQMARRMDPQSVLFSPMASERGDGSRPTSMFTESDLSATASSLSNDALHDKLMQVQHAHQRAATAAAAAAMAARTATSLPASSTVSPNVPHGARGGGTSALDRLARDFDATLHIHDPTGAPTLYPPPRTGSALAAGAAMAAVHDPWSVPTPAPVGDRSASPLPRPPTRGASAVSRPVSPIGRAASPLPPPPSALATGAYYAAPQAQAAQAAQAAQMQHQLAQQQAQMQAQFAAMYRYNLAAAFPGAAAAGYSAAASPAGSPRLAPTSASGRAVPRRRHSSLTRRRPTRFMLVTAGTRGRSPRTATGARRRGTTPTTITGGTRRTAARPVVPRASRARAPEVGFRRRRFHRRRPPTRASCRTILISRCSRICRRGCAVCGCTSTRRSWNTCIGGLWWPWMRTGSRRSGCRRRVRGPSS